VVLDLDQAVVIALGSNLAGGFGACEAVLEEALTRFPRAGLKLQKRSRWWRSAAWPDPDGPEYRNGVALVEPGAGPQATLDALLSIEESLGRQRPSPRNAPRILDLDLIAYGQVVMDEPGLTLPHPRAHERLFVMGPLAEIEPWWMHPTLHLVAATLASTATAGRDATPA
jgi:2-amino-4-hydroxy-6-hydroxymethyldihydropteridine diphosphokinase